MPPFPFQPQPSPETAKALADLRQLLTEFREALADAKRKDIADNAPDCVDPGKAKLEERVAELERRIGIAADLGAQGLINRGFVALQGKGDAE